MPYITIQCQNSPAPFAAEMVMKRRRIDVKVVVHNPVTIDYYKGLTISDVCLMVEHTVRGPLVVA